MSIKNRLFSWSCTHFQIVKMTQAGEVSVESAPYKDLDTCPLPTTPSEPVCPHGTPSLRPETIQEETETEKESETPEMVEEKAEEKREEEKADSRETRRKKLTFKVEGEQVRLRRHPPSRSQTMSNRPPQRSVDLRRQSLCNLRKGETGEMGSKNFRRALRRDSIYEIHPGWESIRKLSKVVG